MKRLWNNIRLTFLLALPVVIFYAGYLFHHSEDLIPTGFIQYDNVGYAAYAKQYLDGGTDGFFYSNPFNESGNYQAIYFQTQNFFLAGLMKLGIPPGWSLCLFSILFCLVAIHTAIRLYDLLYPDAAFRTRTLLLLVWGGGLLVVAGAAALPFRPIPDLDVLDRLFYLDPAWGWWGLNFGRSLLFGVESYYHFLFLAALILALKKRYAWALGVSLILAFSHPFTGIHLLLVLMGWTGLELIFFRKEKAQVFFLTGLIFCAALTLWYYLSHLPSFPDHKKVGEQYAANWYYRFYHFVPAYILVFLLFGGAVYLQTARRFIRLPRNRMLLCLALVSLLLSNHELFMKPMQPIHFARGYEWMAYFLMGVPALHYLFQRLRQRQLLIVLIMAIFLMDNLLWIFNYVRFKATVPTTAYITREQKQVLETIHNHADTTTLIIGSDDLAYLSSVYSQGYPWVSHPYTTPDFHRKNESYQLFLKHGSLLQEWHHRKLIFIIRKENALELERSRSMNTLLETEHYKVAEKTAEE